MVRAFFPADILLPEQGTDMEKWSVVACDQFTSEPKYWEETEKIVGDAPSTLRMILPEVYLDGEEEKERLKEIRYSMRKYLDEGLFKQYNHAMIYIERTDSMGKVRAGIVGCIDLEQYDYHKGSSSLVRATEETVVERIPARIRVRENAQIELPHIMILIDDKERTVIESCEQYKNEDNKLYDFSLMQKGGALKGYLLEEEAQENILSALDKLAEKQWEKSEQMETEDEKNIMLFAMGDGNHSLASAKEHYENLKKQHPGEDYSHHPARYALAEIVNLHSPALEFEAIHRIVTQVDETDFLEQMNRELGISLEENNEHAQQMYVVKKGSKQKVTITKPSSKLTVGSLQNFLDSYQKKNNIKMDYIHGEETVMHLSKQENSIGFLLPDMGKEELFPTVMSDGALPRKTFSMGHAEDKRYYTECRKIR